MQLIFIAYLQGENIMKKILIASVLALIIPLAVNTFAEEDQKAEDTNNGFVAVDLMDTYKLNISPYVDNNESITGRDKKVLFFDVDIMKLKLNYDFDNTETAVKKIIP